MFLSFQIYHSPIHKQAESMYHYQCSFFVFFCSIIQWIKMYSSHWTSLHTHLYVVPLLVKSIKCYLPSTVELNEVGFKFVRKCVNFVETKGKVTRKFQYTPCVFALYVADQISCQFCHSLVSLPHCPLEGRDELCLEWDLLKLHCCPEWTFSPKASTK